MHCKQLSLLSRALLLQSLNRLLEPVDSDDDDDGGSDGGDDDHVDVLPLRHLLLEVLGLRRVFGSHVLVTLLQVGPVFHHLIMMMIILIILVKNDDHDHDHYND